MQEIKYIAVDKKHMSLIWKKPRNKTLISSLVLKVSEREKTEELKKTEKCVSNARKTDNPKEKGNMNVQSILSKHLVKNEKIILA